MAAFITLFDWTEQGVRNAKETVNRGRAFGEALEAQGGRLIGIWWTLGQHDGFAIFEAADDAAATKALVAIGMAGNIRTETMRAFSEDEMESIVGDLP